MKLVKEISKANMKKILSGFLLLSYFLSQANIEVINDSKLKNLEGNLIKFANTNESDENSPNIDELIKKNRKFFAKLIERKLQFGVRLQIKNHWFSFDNMQEANELQKQCYNYQKIFAAEIVITKGSMQAEWYYLDFDKEITEKK